MGRMRENPRYNVISMRISDEERDTLEQLMNTTHKSVSDIMREAMELLKSQLTASRMSAKPPEQQEKAAMAHPSLFPLRPILPPTTRGPWPPSLLRRNPAQWLLRDVLDVADDILPSMTNTERDRSFSSLMSTPYASANARS